MREMKFRFFHKEFNSFLNAENGAVTGYGKIVNLTGSGERWNYVDDEAFRAIVIQQYTGLKDKNGVEIYEGDILTFSKSEDTYRVEQHEGIYYGIDISSTAETLSETPKISPYWWRDNGVGIPTVIGNIHENPELLEQV